MTYNGEEIGFPCQEMIQEFIEHHGLMISAEEVIEYWKEKNFLTKKGQPVKTLEAFVNVANGIYVQKLRKMSCANTQKKLSKTSKWLDNHFKLFCEYMNRLKSENPQKWHEYICEITGIENSSIKL